MDKNNDLNKMKKLELLKIISKMKKKELIKIILNKNGGQNEPILSKTKNAVRKEIIFNQKKINNKEENNVMANDPKYNNIYE